MGETKKGSRAWWALVLVAVVVASYWYWSPFLAMNQMAQAAEEKDADSFNSFVDYPRLRESLKGQFQARMGASFAAQSEENPFAGLGAMLGMAMVNQMLDAMVRPEFVMRAMQEGKVRLERDRAYEDTQSAPSTANGGGPSEAERKELKLVHDRKGVDKVVSYIVDPNRPSAPLSERVSFVFERSGFATWKMTELRLPDKP